MLTECTRRSGRAQRRRSPTPGPPQFGLAGATGRRTVNALGAHWEIPVNLFACKQGEIRACGGQKNLLFLPKASATDIVVGRFFCCLAGAHGPVRPNSIRETAMAYAPPSSMTEHQLKSNPSDAGRRLMGLRAHRGGLRWRSGTGAEVATSFSAKPAVTAGTPSGRSGRQPIPILLLDNRTVVTNHQVGRHRTGRPTMASSHTARCAAAGRRSGLRTPTSRSERPDS